MLAALWTRIKASVKTFEMHFNVWLGSALLAIPTLQQEFPNIQGYLPAKWAWWGTAILAVGNVVLHLHQLGAQLKAAGTPPAQ